MQRSEGERDTLLVTSGKGGVGTSIVAALFALTAAESGRRVLLVDATEGGGTLHHLFGVRPKHSLWMLSHPRVSASDALTSIDETLTLVAGGTSGAAVAPTSDAQRRAALTRLAVTYGDFDLVVFDGGSRLDTINAVGDLAKPRVLLVTSADRLALAANYALVKAVRARRVSTSISVVANRHGDALAAEACDFLVGACSHFLGRSIDVAGAIPDDPCLQAAVGAGMTVRDALSGSPAADAMRRILALVLPSSPAAPRAAAMPALSFPSVSPSLSSRRWS
jgi:MinD-like ATPase involved in chromosome partitioning or flagellar assembly